MYDYVDKIINYFPMKIIKSNTALNPYGNNILKKGNRKRMGKKETEEFHNLVARGMFVAKRAIPDIHQMVAMLSMRVK